MGNLLSFSRVQAALRVCLQKLTADKLIPFELFGEPWVLFRGEDGAAACVKDECAHRACPLSLGKVRTGPPLRRHHLCTAVSILYAVVQRSPDLHTLAGTARASRQQHLFCEGACERRALHRGAGQCTSGKRTTGLS